MPANPPISCYIRAKNEERLIAEVITAARQVADEVVVIDSGSTDKTIPLSEAAGARVVPSPWLGGGKQKRLGEEATKHNWLLDLDADEIVTPELAEEIRALFADGKEPPCPVYTFELVTKPPVGEPWWNASVVKRNRFYDRRVIRARDHAGWDQLEIPPGMKVGKFKHKILHVSFTGLEQLQDKFNKTSSSRAKNATLKSFWYVALRLLFARPFYFLNHYVRRGLWREGWYGFAVANIAAHGRWLKDAKMLEIYLRRRDEAKAGKN
jgi:glycosyltransferase involved in cell wall biosynthesis